jgi:hypothetical protein
MWVRLVDEFSRRLAAKKIADVEAEKVKADEIAKAEAERLEWIERHGSPRLKKCVKHGFDCASVYRDERLARERPGWRLDDGFSGAWDDVKNPSEGHLDWLDNLQESGVKDARLSRLEIQGRWYTGALCEHLGYKLAQLPPDEAERLARNEAEEDQDEYE